MCPFRNPSGLHRVQDGGKTKMSYWLTSFPSLSSFIHLTSLKGVSLINHLHLDPCLRICFCGICPKMPSSVIILMSYQASQHVRLTSIMLTFPSLFLTSLPSFPSVSSWANCYLFMLLFFHLLICSSHCPIHPSFMTHLKYDQCWRTSTSFLPSFQLQEEFLTSFVKIKTAQT